MKEKMIKYLNTRIAETERWIGRLAHDPEPQTKYKGKLECLKQTLKYAKSVKFSPKKAK